MEKEFVTYEQALALKELGFEEPCFGGWDKDRGWWYHPDSDIGVDAPLKQQVFRWFREKYKLFPNFHKNELTDKYRYDEIKNTETYEVLYDSMDYYFNVEFETYEEAESNCIDKLIELVKQGK
jgi:hypothetical protein